MPMRMQDASTRRWIDRSIRMFRRLPREPSDDERAAMRCVAWIALALGAGMAVAQTPEGALTGTLQKVHTSGTVAIGYREASIPLSYLSARNEPIGYSIDLCRAVVAAMSTEVGRDLVIKWVPVTSENRINAVV